MCKDCQAAKESPDYRMFDPTCLYCGARLLQRLESLPIGVTECRQRQKSALSLWQTMGHAEQDLRRLYKGPLSTGPEKGPGSEAQVPTKPRYPRKK